MASDFHLHTNVSDGDLDPAELVREAASRGVHELAITDHDTLAAYRWREGAVFDEARRLGVLLTVGIEMDVALGGREVHLLGLGLDLDAPALGDHLAAVRAARHERARAELALVREHLGEGALAEEDVFAPERDSVMRPHFIRPLHHEAVHIHEPQVSPSLLDAESLIPGLRRSNRRCPLPPSRPPGT